MVDKAFQEKNSNVSSPSKLLITCMMFSVTSVVECLTFVQLWRKVTDRCSLWSWQVFSFFCADSFQLLYRQDIIMNRCRTDWKNAFVFFFIVQSHSGRFRKVGVIVQLQRFFTLQILRKSTRDLNDHVSNKRSVSFFYSVKKSS